MTDLGGAVERLQRAGIGRVESYAWRDLDDPDAGGSEVHADEIFRRWAAAGIAVTHRTSTADTAREFERHDYEVIQRGSRYTVFPRVIARQLVRRRPLDTATIEIWNGVPWFAPLWAPNRRVVWLHHVHRDMWSDALPAPIDRVGRGLETVVAPPWYRRSQIATLSDSSRDEIEDLGVPSDHIAVIPPGVHERFRVDESARARHPHAVVVGRLAPVKRQRLALDALADARRRIPALTVELIGDGPDRDLVDRWITEHDACDWVLRRGRVSDDELVAAYQRAWLVVSASHAEGWGMSITEGAACATPCVATDIAGHRGAAIDGVTGVLTGDDLGAEIAAVLADHDRRAAMAQRAVAHAATLSWTAVAARHLDLLAAACQASSRRVGNDR